jgi:hypothetical protein
MNISPRFFKALILALSIACTHEANANGLGEGRPYQFRTELQRQTLLAGERLRLEFLGFIGSGTGVGVGQGGQTGNAVSIAVGGSNNNITVTQTNTGSQNLQDGSDQWSCIGGMSC